MGDGLTSPLVLAALFTSVVGLLLTARYLPLLAALLVTVVKVTIPVVYFAWYYDGTWTFLDDVTYWNHGKLLLAAGYDPISVLLRIDGLALLVMLSLGPHILYAWWNLLAQYIFGPHYYAAVFLNVALTFLTGVLLYHIARMGGLSRQYAQGFFVFYLLHWEMLAWSSFVNLKDVLVSTLSIAAIFLFLRLANESPGVKAKLVNVAGLVGILLALPWIRFYVPLLLVASFALWVMLTLEGWRRYALLGGAAILLLVVVPLSIPTQYLVLSPAAMVAGLVKTPLTPRPWAIFPEYGFLTVPATLHWLFFGPALVGAWLLWRRSRAVSLVLIFLAAVTFVSALSPEFQGPRHRVQVLFGWAWIQYHIIYSVVAAVARRPTAAKPLPELATAGAA